MLLEREPNASPKRIGSGPAAQSAQVDLNRFLVLYVNFKIISDAQRPFYDLRGSAGCMAKKDCYGCFGKVLKNIQAICSFKTRFNTFAKSIGPRQPAQSAQADISRNFPLSFLSLSALQGIHLPLESSRT